MTWNASVNSTSNLRNLVQLTIIPFELNIVCIYSSNTIQPAIYHVSVLSVLSLYCE